MKFKKPKLTGKPKRIWDFLWNEDSLASWAVNIVIAFILVKFIIYPVLGLAFGTSLPIVAVVSGSMDHDGNFDDWWTSKVSSNETQAHFYLDKLITKQQFQKYPLSKGFSKGDVIILTGSSYEDLRVGDVIVFNGGKNYPIIHRVVQKYDDHLETKGDGNGKQHYPPESTVDELNIEPNQILGRANFRIPWLGWIKIGFSCGVDWVSRNPNIPGGEGFVGCLKEDL